MSTRPSTTRPSTTRGFKRTASVLGAQIRRAGESRGFAVSRLLTHWEEIAGGDLAAIARPVNVSYSKSGFGATLTVLTTGPYAPMVEMQKETLRTRVNGVYGYNAISRVRVTQTAPTGFAEGQADFSYAPKPVAEKPEIAPEIRDQAASLADPVGDSSLREALERLGRNVLSRSKQ